MEAQRTAKEIILWTLDRLVECLGPFVEKHFRSKGMPIPNTRDSYALLKVITQQSYLFEPTIGKLEKTWAHELLEYRNRIAHGVPVTLEDADGALDSAYRLCKSISCDRCDLIAEKIKKELWELRKRIFVRPTVPVPEPEPVEPHPIPTPEPEPFYYKFWDEVLMRMREEGLTSTKQQTSRRSFLGIPAGKAGYIYYLAFPREGNFRVELYIDHDDETINRERFESLKAMSDEIEAQLGLPLSWQQLEGKRACRIAAQRPVHDREVEREELIDWGIKMFVKLRNVFGPLIK